MYGGVEEMDTFKVQEIHVTTVLHYKYTRFLMEELNIRL